MSQPQPQEIKIADNIPGAEYTNLAHIAHPNKDEFHLMFSNISGASGRVVAKVITTPGHFKRMISAMQDNLKAYEEKFGEIKEIETVDREIGFKG